MSRDAFREMFGDELADQVEQLKRKSQGVEVLKPKHKPVPTRAPLPVDSEPDEPPPWWHR